MAYDGNRINDCGLIETDRMHIPIRTVVVLGSLLASAVAVHAHAKAPEATLPTDPATTQQSTAIDLAIQPPATAQPNQIDLTLHPAATQQPTLVDLAIQPPATAQPTPIDLTLHPAATPQPTPIDLTMHPEAEAAPPPSPLDLALPTASAELKQVARWVIDSRDNSGLPFLLIDKVNAQVFAFDPAGQLQGTAPVLLGMARGDHLIVANDTKMAAMPPQARVTPAGRFVSRLAKDSHGKELLVLDYEASISLHPVVKGTPKERRAERLASATAQDNRISFGCINVPPAFYSTIVSPAFTNTKGVVYVLPETSPASALFGLPPVGIAVSGAQPSSTQSSSTVVDARAAQTGPTLDAK
jgi:hypothetical protein